MTFRPIGICWAITNKCNYKCPFCFAFTSKVNANYKIQLKIISALKKQKIKYVSITGGEPFLEKNLLKIVKELKKEDIFVSIDTNGSLLKKNNQILNYIDQISMPLDGSTNNICYKVRNRKNLLSIFDNAIRLIKTKQILIRANTLVCKDNIYDLKNIYNHINKYENKNIIWNLIQYYPINKAVSKYILNPKRYMSILKMFKSEQRINNIFLYHTKKFQESYIVLDPVGNIYIKSNNKHNLIGNILKDDLKRLLTKTKFFNKALHVMRYAKHL